MMKPDPRPTGPGPVRGPPGIARCSALTFTTAGRTASATATQSAVMDVAVAVCRGRSVQYWRAADSVNPPTKTSARRATASTVAARPGGTRRDIMGPPWWASRYRLHWDRPAGRPGLQERTKLRTLLFAATARW